MRLALGEGLLTSEGDFHLKQRRLIQTVFHRRRIEAYGEPAVTYAAQHAGRWQDGAVVDASEEMRELTLRIVVKVLFNSEVPAKVREIGDAVTIINEYLSVRGRNPMGPILHKLPLPLNRRFPPC